MNLNCAVNIEWFTKAGSIGRKVSYKNASLNLKRNKVRDILLEVTNTKTAPIILKVEKIAVHNKFMNEGKASIKFNTENCTLFISNAPSAKLFEFLKIIFIKINADNCKTPSKKVSLRDKLLTGKLQIEDDISPVSDSELKKIRDKIKAKNPETITSPTSRKRHLSDSSLAPAPKKLFSKFTESIELNKEQKRILEACLAGKNIFFTGSAGTGKSFLLRQIIGALPPDVTVATAPTGVAACHIGGVTLHSFAGIGTGEFSIEKCVQLASRPVVSSIWKKCKHLIVDEISMVEGTFFEKLEEVARRIRKNDKPFGGIQLIFCGDFLQLPPVCKSGIKGENKKKFCFQTEAWERCIHDCYELKQVHRQSDPKFINILNNIRIGQVTEKIQDRLSRTSHQKIDKDGILATQLCSLMEDVNRINEQKLNSLRGESKIFEAVDSDKSMSKMLDQQTTIPQTIELKVGAQVMLMKNLNILDGLVNGARGIVVKFIDGYPVVRFKNNQEQLIKPERWSIKLLSGVTLSRKQIPLRLAWAFSIHKSQGLTLDCVEISLNKVFEAGQAYVALSRAKSLETLRIIDFKSTYVWADPDVLLFYKKFKRRLEQTQIIPLGRRKSNLPYVD